jgi:hypothetical protein
MVSARNVSNVQKDRKLGEIGEIYLSDKLSLVNREIDIPMEPY